MPAGGLEVRWNTTQMKMTEPPYFTDEPLAVLEEEVRALAQCFGVAAPAPNTGEQENVAG